MKTIPTSISAERPQGAPFLVDSCPFRYGRPIDYGMLHIEDDKVFDWPMVYILSNRTHAYVGQTTSVSTRMSQHGANEEKRDFDTATIIFNPEFNASVITDYEHRLIGCMHADGKYALTNKNDGMTDTNYFSKSVYGTMFDELWEELREYDLAEHTMKEIEESEIFRYSPFKSLTPDQQGALEKIMAAIDDGLERARPIVVEGMPGTGKTILAIYLLKRLRDDPRYKDMNIRLLEPMTALRGTLKKSLKTVGGLKGSHVIGPSDLSKPKSGYTPGRGRCFDILLVDEAHKLKRRVNLGPSYGSYDTVGRELGLGEGATQLDWVLAQTRLPIFFYDPLQSIGPSCLEPEHIASRLGPALEKPIRLETQMRVKGGEAYLRYIRAILDGSDPDYREFGDYDFVLHEDFCDFIDCFERDLSKHNLTRMLAGYAWEWRTKRRKGDPRSFDIEIEGFKLKWNSVSSNWVGMGIDDPSVAREVGCIHTIQGYDLSYAYVLIGRDLQLDEDGKTLKACRENYHDRNGSAGATSEELDVFIKNIYYVLLTRGISGTHVYVVDPDLRQYFGKYFPQSV